MKTSVQQSDHSSSATYMFAVHRLLIFPSNVTTAKRHCHYHSITASCLPSPRYYHEIFPSHSNYRFYHSITAFPITVSSFTDNRLMEMQI